MPRSRIGSAWARCAANWKICLPLYRPGQLRAGLGSRRKPPHRWRAVSAQREDTLSEQLRENSIEARVEWRIKRIYSIFQKQQRSKISFDQVYDFLAIRVITQDVGACYAVFGLIHTLWRPVPGRIKDFIAMPRANCISPWTPR